MILMMGIAGAGKGTQSKLLAERHGYQLVTSGDAVRDYASEAQRERMLRGELLADDEIIEIINKMLEKVSDGHEILMDGFPRTIPQAEWLLAQAGQGRFNLESAFHLVASRDEVKQRLLGRARQDDVEDAINQRFDEYERSTTPLLKWLTEHGVEVIDINAERPVEAVYADLDSHLKESK